MNEKIQFIEDFISHKQSPLPSEESYQILFDAYKGYKIWLFFSSMSWFWVFIEKFLREKLILTLFDEDREGGFFEFSKKFDAVEEEIEESQYEGEVIEMLKEKLENQDFFKNLTEKEKNMLMKFTSGKRMFQHIVKRLIESGKIEERFGKTIIKSYHDNRSIVQHGVYRRLYKLYDETVEIPMTAIVGSEVSDWSLSSHQRLPRMFHIRWAAEMVCNDALEIIYDLLKIFEKSN